MLKAVFFDAAGTLFEAREPVGHTYARIARTHGLHTDDASVTAGFRRAFASTSGLAFGPGRQPKEIGRLEREWWHGVVQRSFEGLGEFDTFDAFFEELFAYFAHPRNWVTLPGAHSALRQLKQGGLRLGIISNFDQRLYRILEGLELRPFFETITISSEAGYAKPARAIFATALASLGVTSDEAVHVGDSEHLDVRGAQEAGIGAILIDTETDGASVPGRTATRVSTLAETIEVVRLLRFTE